MRENQWIEACRVLELSDVGSLTDRFGTQIRGLTQFSDLLSVDDLRVLASAAQVLAKVTAVASMVGATGMVAESLQTSLAIKGLVVYMASEKQLIGAL